MTYIGPLHQSVATTKTDLWNDSCSLNEIRESIKGGAVGATTNPVIVTEVLKKELPYYKETILKLIADNPYASEDEIAWLLIQHMAIEGAAEFMPIFEQSKGDCGRLSIQTDARLYNNAKAMAAQAVSFSKLAPNMMVKMPVTEAGVAAIEESTYQGVNVNATVCFTVPQAVAVAEAVEAGINRRKAEGLPTADMRPVCTIMVGRLDDWLKVVADKEKIVVDPGLLDWAGVAAFKNAYKIFNERGYTTRLLAAAYRNHLHWSELIGGDVVLTIPYSWQVKFNNSTIEPIERMNNAVDDKILHTLHAKFPDFTRAYTADGIAHKDFLQFGATARTLRSFIQGYTSLLNILRDIFIQNPDI